MNTIEYYINEYVESLKVRHYAKETIKKHKRNLDFFFSWSVLQAVTITSHITKDFIESYLVYLLHFTKDNGSTGLTNRGQSFTVRARRERTLSLKLFFSFVVKQDGMFYNPLAETELPKIRKSIPKEVLTETEVTRVLSLPDINIAQGLRDRAMLETFYSTGIRRAELVNLSLYDLNKERGILMIRQGKGRKDRVVPIGDRAIKWVTKYIDEARVQLQTKRTTDTLFISVTGVKLKLNSVTTLVHDYIKKAKLNKSGSCHIFRHTMATLMLENGCNLRYIQEILGHSELKTTQIYTKVSIKKLHEVYKRSHPSSFAYDSSL